MNKKIAFRFSFLLMLLSQVFLVSAQDTLPKFTVVNRNGKVILSWVNKYPVVKQLSIQRSSDSTKGFKTILTLPDPTSITNGFLDNNAPDTNSFYKLYILLDKGEFVFSKAQRPHPFIPPPLPKPQATITMPKNETTSEAAIAHHSNRPAEPDQQGQIVPAEPSNEAKPKNYTMQSASINAEKRRSGELKPGNVSVERPKTYTPSGFVFTNPSGDVTIVLPPDRLANFKIKFYEESGNMLFQIDSVSEHIFTVDKSNFLHAGWFSFELFEGGVLKEKNKVRVP